MIFKAIKGSQSGSYVFDATVIDTSKPMTVYGNGDEDYLPICECYIFDDAKKVADALNKNIKNN